MKILFVVGYQKEKWNTGTWYNKGLGGSEYSVMKLAEVMSNKHDVTICGDVITSISFANPNLKYCEYDKLESNSHYDVVIATNYIHYLIELESRNITFDKSYFWLHNFDFYPWWNGITLENDGLDYLKSSKIDNFICVSEYQANILEKKYPQMRGRIRVIENAISTHDFLMNSVGKIPNRFIYTSSAERGLSNLLEIWPRIKQTIPDATLVVATPPYALDIYDSYKSELEGVEYVGSLGKIDLYNLINSAEYWLYPSQYDETYCITALEMMMGEVKIVSTDTGNLLNLVNGKAKLISHKSSNEEFLEAFLDLYLNKSLQETNLKNAKEYALKNTWDIRVNEWYDVIDTPKRYTKVDCVYVIGLSENFNNYDRWVSEINKLGLDPRSVIHIHRAVDGSNLNIYETGDWSVFQNWKIDSDNKWYSRPVLPGEIGCALSHIQVWNLAKESGHETILILEEDFMVHDELTPYLVDELPSDWDLLYLGRNKLSPGDDTELGLHNIVKPYPSYNTHAYMLSKNGVEKLLNKNLQDNIIPLDEFFICTYSNHPNRNDLGFIESDINAYSLRNQLISQGYSQPKSSTETIHLNMKLHPELYTYYENPIEWKNRFVSYSARTKEWDLITDEPFDNCFSFPLFTEEFCRMIREEAEFANNWTVDRHQNYPTTDMLLETIGMNQIYMEVLREYVMQFSTYMWALEGNGWNTMFSENFLAKYTPDAQGHLSIHHDSSDITCLVQLSDLDEYDGGGTWFRRQKKLVKNPIGYCTIHPGNITHKHGARAVTRGTRYIIVSFMKNSER